MLVENMTSDEFLEGLKKTRTVLLPVGSTEGHGWYAINQVTGLEGCGAIRARQAQRRAGKLNS